MLLAIIVTIHATAASMHNCTARYVDSTNTALLSEQLYSMPVVFEIPPHDQKNNINVLTAAVVSVYIVP